MTSTRGLTGGPDNALLRVPFYICPIHDRWSAPLVADGVVLPGPDEVKGVGVFGGTADEADRLAKACLGLSEPVS